MYLSPIYIYSLKDKIIKTAKKKPSFFLRLEQKTNGYHTPSRSRYMWYNGKRIPLDKNDVGGEHE